MFVKGTCEEFVKLLGSNEPTPGGGGAAALVGAVGVALGNMVASLTVGKKKYAEVEDEMRTLATKADILQDELLCLVEEDAEAFGPLAKAYGLPKETEAQKAEKDKILGEALHMACTAPLKIMEKCCVAIDMHREFAAKGSRLAVSDAGVGVAFCKAALKGASLNVFINTKAMKDREYARNINERAHDMLKQYEKAADEIFDSVLKQLE
jgi:formiminotetrahydrofolate cyclodeaminase